MQPIARIIEQAGVSVNQVAAAAGLNVKLVKAIVAGNFTPDPAQRRRLAAALGVAPEAVSWGHAVAVQHLRGNGPQAGRPT